jgi:pimeloyl-ACP methyl ester carboxylesterase
VTALMLSAVSIFGSLATAGGPTPDPDPAPATTPAATARRPRGEDFAPPEEFVMVDEIATHFVRKGGTGRPVVLVHGFGSSTHTWQKTLDALAARHQVYALDLKGFGLTAKPKDGQYHMEAYTRHLLGFLDVMKLDRPVLVGHSLGGAIVTRLALLHPDRVGALVLEDPIPVTLPRATATELLKRAGDGGVAGEHKPGTAAHHAALLNPALARRMLPTLLRSTITRQTVENGLKVAYHDPKFVTPELVEIVYRPLTFEGAAEALASMMNPPPVPAAPLPPLDGLRLPALIAWGGHDKVMPIELFEQYVASIPGAVKVIFAESGHVPHEEEAVAFNARLLEFLDRLP